MKGRSFQQFSSLLLILLVSVLSLSAIWFFGCTPSAQQQGPSISQERQKAINDSLNQIYIRQLNLHWSTAYEYYKNKMYRNSIKPFWKVIEIDTIKRFDKSFTYLSDAYIQLNNADSAEIVLKLGVEKFPEDAYLHRNLGYIFATRGRTEDAIQQYELALKVDNTKVNDWKQLANLYIKNDQPEDAIHAYEKVVELDATDKDAHETLSQLYRSTGDADAAINRMEEVKRLDPKNLDNLFNLGKEYFNNDDFENAIVNFEALLSQKPDDISAMTYLGSSLQNTGKYSRAINIFTEILSVQPENKKAYADIAICYKELGKFPTARQFANKALAVDAEYGLAYIVRGDIYAATVEKCMADNKKDIADFDDKLVYELAYNEYQRATKDLQFKDMATAKMNYIKDYIPNQEDRFFHKGQTKAKKECYNWIY